MIAPVLLIAALAIRVTSRGPVLYRGQRLGLNGTVFTMHKLRTMRRDADQVLADVIHLNVARGMIKIPDDPRQTRVGRILRRLSIDELPQLWDVLRGEMSLVGPRPHVPGELDADDPDLAARLVMRPGMTGLWQVSARTHPSLETRVRYDLDYIAGWSLLADLGILLRTIPAVLRADGGSAQAPAEPHSVELRIVEALVPAPYDAYFGDTVARLATEAVRVETADLG